MRKLTIAIVLLAAVIGLGTTDIRAQAVRAQAKPAEIRLDYSFIVHLCVFCCGTDTTSHHRALP